MMGNLGRRIGQVIGAMMVAGIAECSRYRKSNLVTANTVIAMRDLPVEDIRNLPIRYYFGPHVIVLWNDSGLDIIAERYFEGNM